LEKKKRPVWLAGRLKKKKAGVAGFWRGRDDDGTN
jgi:hypothetical protein